MKKLLLLIFVFVIILCTNIYASEIESETYVFDGVSGTSSEYAIPPAEVVSGDYYYFSDNQDADINAILNNPDSSDNDLLRAILVCVKDLDIYVQFFVTMVFAIGLVYFVILKPLRYFLN